ncbi:MAG TPA: retropepsin-like aspartic protease [Stellaceae bacterium]|nr:retropepsin-like aspartic protease [Stellaceae bacterium]
MKRKDGNLWVPAQINKVVTIDFVIDSGASDITLPRDVYQTLIRSGTLTKADYIGTAQFGIADGSEVKGIKFKLASFQVGNQVLTDVVASVMPSDSATPLLGLSFLSRFQSWAIDNNSGTLKLTPLGAEPTAQPPAQAAAATAQPLTDLTSVAAPSAQPPAAALAAAQTPATTGPVVLQGAPPQMHMASAAPRSRQVPSSALIVKDASPPVTVAEAAPPPTTSSPKPDTAATVPNFPANTPYANARSSLLALGYGPAPLPDAGKFDSNTDSTCFPEREACAKADNGVQCDFFWRRGEQVIKVKTVAVPPTVAAVECQVNCK